MNTPVFLLPLLALTGLSIGVGAAQAQVYQPSNRIPVADNTLGTQVVGSNNNFAITGGVNRGQNTFHSFQDFSVPTNGVANFANPIGNQNIITRVTGNLFSDINGTINTQGANFLLINPNGVVFGPGTQLNVGKAFTASTASGIDLVDGAGKTLNFGVNGAGDGALLSIDPKVIFNASRLNLGGVNGEIKNFGTLQTNNPSQYIGLVGGNVNLDAGKINAPSGRIELGGLSAPGSVEISTEGGSPRLNFPTGVDRSNLVLNNQARVSVAGVGSGNIAISAHNVDLLGDSVVRGGIEENLGTANAVAGDINLRTTGTVVIENSTIANSVRANSQGRAGNINIEANTLSLRKQGDIQTRVLGKGDAGSVQLKVAGAIDIADKFSGINSLVTKNGVGNASDIFIDAGSLSLRKGASIISVVNGQGNSGNVSVNGKGAIDLDGATIFTNMEGLLGNAGNININADSLSLLNGATIDAISFGRGNAGNISTTTRKSVYLAGADSRISASIQVDGVGKGGDININADSLSLLNGATIDAVSFGQGNAGNISATTKKSVYLAGAGSVISSSIQGNGVGKGGDIKIRTQSLSLNNGAQLQSSVLGKGDGGDISIFAKDAVFADKNTAILTNIESGNIGNSGNINLDVDSLSMTNGAQLLASNFGQGNAGNINIRATKTADISGQEGALVTSLKSILGENGTGNAGNINIDANSFSLRNAAQIQTTSLGKGNAGNIRISTKNATELSDKSAIFSTIEKNGTGRAGNIDINSTSLLITEGSQIFASSSGNGDSGSINVKASDSVFLSGTESQIKNAINNGATGNAGNIDIDAGSISLQDRAGVITASGGNGNAGNITVVAKDAINLAGSSSAFISSVLVGGIGKGGDINIKSGSLSLTDGSLLLSINDGIGDSGNVNVKVRGIVDIIGVPASVSGGISTFVGNQGNSGDIIVEASSLSLRNGAGFLAANVGQGNAGTINIKATDYVLLSGVGNNAQRGLLVNSLNEKGIAGNIVVLAPRITLDKGFVVNADSASGNGGNIFIGNQPYPKVTVSSNNLTSDVILMRNGSKVTTNASGVNQQNSNGGNINFNSDLIVAIPKENSDITANAIRGRGGNVAINTQGLFGTLFRPRQTSNSDITASSDFGQSGNISINTPGIDPGKDTSKLPARPIDASKQITQRCSATQEDNQFYVTGRGGHPSNTSELLNNDVVWLDPRHPRTQSISINSIIQQAQKTPQPAVGWAFNGKGKVTLLSPNHDQSILMSKVACSTIQKLPSNGFY
jgi:filamentous hemagglutinin family protein